MLNFSLIIPTYNRPEFLQKCLDSIICLNYPKDQFEVIIVDDGSDQPLDLIVKPYYDQINLTLIRQCNGGPAKARNVGADNAKGQYLAFTDDDCTLDQNWLLALEKGFSRCTDALLGGKTINALPKNLYSSASQLLIDYLYDYYNDNFVQTRFFTTNNFALSRELFKQVGGFNESFRTSEDREFCDRWLFLGYSLNYIPEAIIYHAHELNLQQFWQQHFNYGCGGFYFHKIRSQRNQIPLKFEPLSFYLQLLTYPFLSQSQQSPKILIFCLFLLSQLANAWGMFKTKLQNTT